MGVDVGGWDAGLSETGAPYGYAIVGDRSIGRAGNRKHDVCCVRKADKLFDQHDGTPIWRLYAITGNQKLARRLGIELGDDLLALLPGVNDPQVADRISSPVGRYLYGGWPFLIGSQFYGDHSLALSLGKDLCR